MSKDEALTLALEALESKYVVGCGVWRAQQVKAITAIKQALAQPEQELTGIREIRVTETVKQEQESVGEVNRHGRDSHGRQWHSIHWYDANVDVPHGTKLYTAPPKSEQEPVLQDIEQYRLQMAGISTAAIGYWKESDGILPDYDTVALRDVAKLYSKYDALYKARWSAQPEQEPIVCCGDYATCMKSCTPRGKWLAEQEPVADRLVRQYINSLVANKPDEAANATKAMVDYVYTSPPAQPKQEPVAWMCAPFGDTEYEFSAHQECENCVPCYTTPPKREWVGLTDDDLVACSEAQKATVIYFLAKLKKKNT